MTTRRSVRTASCCNRCQRTASRCDGWWAEHWRINHSSRQGWRNHFVSTRDSDLDDVPDSSNSKRVIRRRCHIFFDKSVRKSSTTSTRRRLRMNQNQMRSKATTRTEMVANGSARTTAAMATTTMMIVKANDSTPWRPSSFPRRMAFIESHASKRGRSLVMTLTVLCDAVRCEVLALVLVPKSRATGLHTSTLRCFSTRQRQHPVLANLRNRPSGRTIRTTASKYCHHFHSTRTFATVRNFTHLDTQDLMWAQFHRTPVDLFRKKSSNPFSSNQSMLRSLRDAPGASLLIQS
mmetsp:Transcript_14808/g.40999  ORF Transcript_14808/g.40999 Transcript_14808/m.40999 type:complete len:292 (+) Transcript_14808:242-1117(+)